MLDVYTHQQEVSVSVTLPTYKGATIAPTAVEYAVHDEDGTELIARQALAGYTSGNPVIDVPAASNTLVSADRGLRIVSVWMTTADDGVFERRERYVIQTFDVLKPFTNSFQSLDKALLNAAAIVDLPGWEAATDQQKIAAMIEAHERVCRLHLRYKVDPGLEQSVLDGEYYTYVSNARLITDDDWLDFPSHFKNALMRAQIIEADTLLAGDPIRDKRMAGVISETIGEAKMFFNNRAPLSLPVARRTLDALGGYFYYKTGLARG